MAIACGDNGGAPRDAEPTDATADAAGLDASTPDASPIAPTQLVVLAQPTALQAGEPFAPSPQIALEEATGAIATSTPAQVTLALASGVLAGTTSRAATNGVATFDALHIDAPGDYTITASASQLPPVTTAPAKRLSRPVAPRMTDAPGTGMPNALRDTTVSVVAVTPSASRMCGEASMDDSADAVPSAIAIGDHRHHRRDTAPQLRGTSRIHPRDRS